MSFITPLFKPYQVISFFFFFYCKTQCITVICFSLPTLLLFYLIAYSLSTQSVQSSPRLRLSIHFPMCIYLRLSIPFNRLQQLVDSSELQNSQLSLKCGRTSKCSSCKVLGHRIRNGLARLSQDYEDFPSY